MQIDAKDSSSAIDWTSIPLAEPGTHMRGPTPTSNWVIKGHLLAGGYPGTYICIISYTHHNLVY
jgi:hypothetical protein